MTVELRPFVREFAELIELKLRENDNKTLEGVSSHYLYTKLMEEITELFDANQLVHENNYYVPNDETPDLARKVSLEAADVAAVAGFFAARLGVLTDPGVHREYSPVPPVLQPIG